MCSVCFFFFKQKTAYEMRISDWSSDVCSSDLRACALQVKTRREIGSDAGWHRKARHEGIRSASLFYVFLSFRNDLQRLPDAFVIPSAVVADALYQAHRAWLARPRTEENSSELQSLMRIS